MGVKGIRLPSKAKAKKALLAKVKEQRKKIDFNKIAASKE